MSSSDYAILTNKNVDGEVGYGYLTENPVLLSHKEIADKLEWLSISDIDSNGFIDTDNSIFGFSTALELLKIGFKVSRKGIDGYIKYNKESKKFTQCISNSMVEYDFFVSSTDMLSDEWYIVV